MARSHTSQLPPPRGKLNPSVAPPALPASAQARSRCCLWDWHSGGVGPEIPHRGSCWRINADTEEGGSREAGGTAVLRAVVMHSQSPSPSSLDRNPHNFALRPLCCALETMSSPLCFCKKIWSVATEISDHPFPLKINDLNFSIPPLWCFEMDSSSKNYYEETQAGLSAIQTLLLFFVP